MVGDLISMFLKIICTAMDKASGGINVRVYSECSNNTGKPVLNSNYGTVQILMRVLNWDLKFAT